MQKFEIEEINTTEPKNNPVNLPPVENTFSENVEQLPQINDLPSVDKQNGEKNDILPASEYEENFINPVETNCGQFERQCEKHKLFGNISLKSQTIRPTQPTAKNNYSYYILGAGLLFSFLAKAI